VDSSDNPSEKRYILAKGFVHGREVSLNPVYGVFVCVSTSSETKYVSILFSKEPVDDKTSMDELISKLAEKSQAAKEESLASYEKDLSEYIRTNRVFQVEPNHLDTRAMERKISYFCSESLQINAITVLEITLIGEDALHSMFPSMPESVEGESDDGGSSDDDGSEDKEASGPQEIYVSCNPVLDPVSGVAAGEIEPGDSIYCMLPEESSFYKLLQSNSPDFNGMIVCDVAGVHVNEFGSAVVALALADGVSGTLKLSGSVRVKLNSKGLSKRAKRNITRTDVAFAVAGMVLFLCAMGVIMYFFT
jgi:hypothetical protein